MNDDLRKRLELLRSRFASEDLDAVLISSPSNIVYYSAFSGFSQIERDGYVFLTKKTGYLLTNPLYAEAVKHEVTHLTPVIYSGTTPLREHVKKIAAAHKLTRVGFEDDDLTVSEFAQFRKVLPKLTSINLHSVRRIKTTSEIQDIIKACRIAEKGLKKTLPFIRPGITEKELVKRLEDEIRRAGADIAFPTIAAFGRNAAVPHHKSNMTTLKRNDVILIDFGATSNEYRSDMTRTFFIGNASTEQTKAYEAVLTAQQEASAYIEKQLHYLASGVEKYHIPAADVDNAAREYLLAQGYPSIPHSLGHGIGLDVHEAPSLSPYSQDALVEGMVFSIEPGVYPPGKYGIRIEDLYTIRHGKLEQLTHFPSTLHIM